MAMTNPFAASSGAPAPAMPQMGVGSGNFPATPAAPSGPGASGAPPAAPMAAPGAPPAPPAPGADSPLKQMQSLGDALFKQYGTDTQAMQQDPRFAQLQQLREGFGKDPNQQTWDQEAAAPAPAAPAPM